MELQPKQKTKVNIHRGKNKKHYIHTANTQNCY